MNIKKQRFTAFAATAVYLLSMAVTGCGGPGGSGPNPSVEQDRLKAMSSMRSLYDKAHGDYSALSPGDQAAFAKYVPKGGDPQKTFEMMKTGSRSANSAASAPSGG